MADPNYNPLFPDEIDWEQLAFSNTTPKVPGAKGFDSAPIYNIDFGGPQWDEEDDDYDDGDDDTGDGMQGAGSGYVGGPGGFRENVGGTTGGSWSKPELGTQHDYYAKERRRIQEEQEEARRKAKEAREALGAPGPQGAQGAPGVAGVPGPAGGQGPTLGEITRELEEQPIDPFNPQPFQAMGPDVQSGPPPTGAPQGNPEDIPWGPVDPFFNAQDAPAPAPAAPPAAPAVNPKDAPMAPAGFDPFADPAAPPAPAPPPPAPAPPAAPVAGPGDKGFDPAGYDWAKNHPDSEFIRRMKDQGKLPEHFNAARNNYMSHQGGSGATPDRRAPPRRPRRY